MNQALISQARSQVLSLGGGGGGGGGGAFGEPKESSTRVLVIW